MAATAWKITLEGREYREYDLTIDDVEAMEAATGETWRTLNPLRSASIAKQMAIVLLVRKGGMDRDIAVKTVGDMPLTTFVDSVSYYDPEDDLPVEYQDGNPPVADGTSTSS